MFVSFQLIFGYYLLFVCVWTEGIHCLFWQWTAALVVPLWALPHPQLNQCPLSVDPLRILTNPSPARTRKDLFCPWQVSYFQLYSYWQTAHANHTGYLLKTVERNIFHSCRKLVLWFILSAHIYFFAVCLMAQLVSLLKPAENSSAMANLYSMAKQHGCHIVKY